MATQRGRWQLSLWDLFLFPRTRDTIGRILLELEKSWILVMLLSLNSLHNVFGKTYTNNLCSSDQENVCKYQPFWFLNHLAAARTSPLEEEREWVPALPEQRPNRTGYSVPPRLAHIRMRVFVWLCWERKHHSLPIWPFGIKWKWILQIQEQVQRPTMCEAHVRRL